MKSHTLGACQSIGPVHGHNCIQHNLHREYDHDVVQVLDIPTRNSIPESRRCKGMYVLVLSDRTFYRLVKGLTNDCWVACGKNEISADYLPNASKTQKGVVQIGDNIDVDSNGLIAVPVAAADTLGVVKGGDNINIAADGTLSVETTGGFTTMETLTTSQTWIVPKTGYYRVTCVGGGGGGGEGGSAGNSVYEGTGGGQGGTTFFDDHIFAAGGSGGGGGGHINSGGGGQSGLVCREILHLLVGTEILCMVGTGGLGGAGGSTSTSYYTANHGEGPCGGRGNSIVAANGGAGGGAPGAGNGTFGYNSLSCGGSGGTNGTGFGGGGGGGKSSQDSEPGAATDGGEYGAAVTQTSGKAGYVHRGAGGNGGSGAIIIEY